MINHLRLKYPVPFIKRVLDISSSRYYAWQDRPMSRREQKIFGGFRSDAGNAAFDHIRSYIATAIKQGISVFEAIQAAVSGKPLFTAENH